MLQGLAAVCGLLAPIPALTLGMSRGTATIRGPLALLQPNCQEGEEYEVAVPPGAKRSILLTNRLLNGALGTMPASARVNRDCVKQGADSSGPGRALQASGLYQHVCITSDPFFWGLIEIPAW